MSLCCIEKARWLIAFFFESQLKSGKRARFTVIYYCKMNTSFWYQFLQRTFLLALAYAATGSCNAIAQEGEGKAARYFSIFETQAQELSLKSESESKEMQWIQEPLMRFTVSDSIFGSVYLWLDQERRPAVIGTIGSLSIRGKDEGFSELHLLTSSRLRPLTIESVPPKTWSPLPMDKTAPIAGSPSVAATPASRLVQMRTIARSYSVQMNDPQNRPAELRLLPQPLYRYEEPTMDRDGSIFAFVWTEGTDPELLLRIESRQVDGKPVWCMQPLRFTWRALKLLRDGQEVWEGRELLTRDRLVQDSPYITTLTSEIK